jgi:hypothetical protein
MVAGGIFATRVARGSWRWTRFDVMVVSGLASMGRRSTNEVLAANFGSSCSVATYERFVLSGLPVKAPKLEASLMGRSCLGWSLPQERRYQ